MRGRTWSHFYSSVGRRTASSLNTTLSRTNSTRPAPTSTPLRSKARRTGWRIGKAVPNGWITKQSWSNGSKRNSPHENNRGSRIEDRGWRHSRKAIFYLLSSILDPRSSILDPRSSILNPRWLFRLGHFELGFVHLRVVFYLGEFARGRIEIVEVRSPDRVRDFDAVDLAVILVIGLFGIDADRGFGRHDAAGEQPRLLVEIESRAPFVGQRHSHDLGVAPGDLFGPPEDHLRIRLLDLQRLQAPGQGFGPRDVHVVHRPIFARVLDPPRRAV